MRTRALRTTFISLLAASAMTALVPAVASAAPTAIAGDPTDCRTQFGGDTVAVRPGQRIESGASLADKVSPTVLVMQADGNLVLYAIGNSGGYKLPLWSSGTYGNPGAYALMQEDGNFVVYKKDGGPDKGGALWATGTYGDAASPYLGAYLVGGEFSVEGRSYYPTWRTRTREQHAKICASLPDRPQGSWWPRSWAESATVWMVLQEDGNLVMYRKRDGKAIWSSGTYGLRYSATLEMDPKGDLILREGDQASTVRWHSGTDGNPDAYALLQDDGNFVVYKKDGGPGKGGALWATGTYNKI
ncbi:hypothetical protein [Streptomyces sp. NPDC091371]|uniref:hypothetical protein n=1 Tax=Streptomyces sp. NPDC091371 TaxID=3155303 RepID=UPI0034363690